MTLYRVEIHDGEDWDAYSKHKNIEYAEANAESQILNGHKVRIRKGKDVVWEGKDVRCPRYNCVMVR